MTPEEAAQNFVHRENAFHLGFLPTEQSHPKTAQLAQVAKDDAAEACRLIFSVDEEMITPLSRILSSSAFAALRDRLVGTLEAGGRVVFSGCGATGRLSLLLEAAWREYWNRQAGASARSDDTVRRFRDRVGGFMTGGDYAFIRSVEFFEDYEVFGACQVAEWSLGPGDCLVGISEGGETSSVLGSVRAARDRGAAAVFVCNNPHGLLSEHIERSRRILTDPSILCLDCHTGPMALAGSTRMQATTVEWLVVGAALEDAIERLSGGRPSAAGGHRLDSFGNLLAGLMRQENRDALGRWIEREAEIYTHSGVVTYFADRAMIDILTDTTERTPTFALPPLQPADRTDAARPWAMVQSLTRPTAETWRHMLGRDPVCLEWTKADYLAMKAAPELAADPPRIGRDALYAFPIGCDPESSRYRHESDAAIMIRTVSDEAGRHALDREFRRAGKAFPRSWRVVLQEDGAKAVRGGDPNDIVLRCPMPRSPFRLFEHLALKWVFNTVSTVTMARIGRVTGNWMTHVQPTNKKLIDRSCRILRECAGLSYEEACVALFREMDGDTRPMAERGSPVHAILHRLTRANAGDARS